MCQENVGESLPGLAACVAQGIPWLFISAPHPRSLRMLVLWGIDESWPVSKKRVKVLSAGEADHTTIIRRTTKGGSYFELISDPR